MNLSNVQLNLQSVIYKIIKHSDGSFQQMKSNYVGIDYTYVIIDDDIDMMYFQKDWFVNTDAYEGLTLKKAKECIQILNKI